jgi:hypothetical protein
MRRLPMLLVCAAAATMCLSATPAWAYVYGPSPQAVTLAVTKKFAAHEVKAWNQPQVSYTLGTCHLLHRRPWLAYSCGFELHGVPRYCHGVVTVGIKRLANGSYRGQEVRSKYIDDKGC